MSERYQVFDVKELESVSCKCPNCATVIMFSVLLEEKFGIPDGCPTCSKELNDLAAALQDYRTFYRMGAKLGIRLHTKPVTEQA